MRNYKNNVTIYSGMMGNETSSSIYEFDILDIIKNKFATTYSAAIKKRFPPKNTLERAKGKPIENNCPNCPLENAI